MVAGRDLEYGGADAEAWDEFTGESLQAVGRDGLEHGFSAILVA